MAKVCLQKFVYFSWSFMMSFLLLSRSSGLFVKIVRTTTFVTYCCGENSSRIAPRPLWNLVLVSLIILYLWFCCPKICYSSNNYLRRPIVPESIVLKIFVGHTYFVCSSTLSPSCNEFFIPLHLPLVTCSLSPNMTGDGLARLKLFYLNLFCCSPPALLPRSPLLL